MDVGSSRPRAHLEAASEEPCRRTPDGSRSRDGSALREHRRRQGGHRDLAGPLWQDGFTDWRGLTRDALVWTYGDGSPIHPKTFYERFLRLTAAAGLPRIRLHDYVRHSYASAALAAATGWHDVKVISQRLGHASVSITLDTYSHVLPAADSALANTLASVILGKR